MFDEYRGIPRTARLIVYLSVLPNVVVTFIYVDLSYFLADTRGFGAGFASSVITLMGVTLVVTSVPMGVLADRYGRRRLLILGNVLASLSLVGFALTADTNLIYLTAVVEGLGEAAFAVSVGSLLAENAGNEKRTVAFSSLALVGWVSGALGSFAITTVSLLQGYNLSVADAHSLLYSVVGLMSLAIIPLQLRIPESAASRSLGEGRGIIPRKSSKVLLRFGLYSVAIALGAGLFVPIMTVWFKAAFRVPDTSSANVLGLINLATATVVFLSPRLAARLGMVKAIVLTQASSTVFMVAVPLAPTFGLAAGIYGIRVFLMNLSNPLTQSMIMGLVSPDERGMASGIAASLWRLPNALSTRVGGALIEAGQLGLPFYIATILYCFGIGAFWVFFRTAKLPEERLSTSQVPVQSSSLEALAESA